MNKLSIFLRGILVGFASLAVPGLSASTVAIVLLVYYDMIYAISHIFKEPKRSLSFLAVLIAGYGVGALGGAVAVNTLYVRFPIPVIAAVLGFLIGSIPRMMVESREDFKHWYNILIMILVAGGFLVYALVITDGEMVSFDVISFPSDYIMIALVGLITSATLVIPGVDFAVTLMALGYYYAFIGLVGDFVGLILHPSRFFLLLSYLVGYGVGSFLFSSGLRYLIKRFPRQLHCVNLAMVFIAPAIVVEKCVFSNPNINGHATWQQFCWAFLMFGAGYFAFTWVPMLCRYLGFLPKQSDKVILQEETAARSGLTPDQVTADEQGKVILQNPPEDAEKAETAEVEPPTGEEPPPPATPPQEEPPAVEETPAPEPKRSRRKQKQESSEQEEKEP